jgi:hypothetical protein
MLSKGATAFLSKLHSHSPCHSILVMLSVLRAEVRAPKRGGDQVPSSQLGELVSWVKTLLL